MNDVELRNLLQRADESVSRKAVSQLLTSSVRQGAARRRTIRRSVATVAIVMMVAPLWIFENRQKRVPLAQKPRKIEVASVAAPPTLEELETQAQVAQRTADAILLARRDSQAGAQVMRADALSRLAEAVDQTTLIMVGSGDHLRRQGDAAQASAAYRRVRELFPGTIGAAIAGERLGEIHS